MRGPSRANGWIACWSDAGWRRVRTRAQRLIAGGHVLVAGRPARKASDPVADPASIVVSGDDCPWVSRGGLKLDFALRHFAIEVRDKVALDLGASTGGFSEVLLARGAIQVVAVDVGHGQLHPRLTAQPRLIRHEGLNVRDLTAAHLPEAPDLIVADLSFISLTVALPAALALAKPDARLVALVKPQFEVGRALLGKGGLVRDRAAREAALAKIRDWLAAQSGWSILGGVESPIAGGHGNREYLLAAARHA